MLLAKCSFGPAISIDLYYNDLNKEKPCTVMLVYHLGLKNKVKHFRAETFADALFNTTVFVASTPNVEEIKD